MGAPPRVSVIVTCYDLGRYLDEAVASVLGQTFQDFEILIVDDGSTEPETVRLLADYRRPKTRVVHTENRGLPGARNLGLQHTSGQYVCSLDADDVLEPTMLEKSVRLIEGDPSVAFVSHWLRTFGDEEWEWTPRQCDLATLVDTNTVNGAALVRRSALLAVGGFDEAWRDGCEDWDLWITLLERGFRGTIIPEVLFRYRRRPDSMSRLMPNAGLYRRLAAKHADTYRRHLRELWLRRATVTGDLLRHTYGLRLEERVTLGPAVQARRERLAALRDRAEREESARAEAAERHGVAARVAELERRLAEAQDHVAETAAARDRAWGDAEALRRSLSWRITAPLRRVYAGLRRLAGGGDR